MYKKSATPNIPSEIYTKQTIKTNRPDIQIVELFGLGVN